MGQLFDEKYIHVLWDDELEGKDNKASENVELLDDKYVYHTWTDGDKYRVKPDEKNVTYKELAMWLAKGNGQYRKVSYGNFKIKEPVHMHTELKYADGQGGYDVPNSIMVKRWEDGEWHNPTVDYIYKEVCE